MGNQQGLIGWNLYARRGWVGQFYVECKGVVLMRGVITINVIKYSIIFQMDWNGVYDILNEDILLFWLNYHDGNPACIVLVNVWCDHPLIH